MSQWPSVKAKRLLAALLRLGWQIKRQSGSHKHLPVIAGPILFSPSTMATKSVPKCWRALQSTRGYPQITCNPMSADFVVCNKDSSIVAVIELDDATHQREDRQAADAKKDKALGSAGVQIVRWQAKAIPDLATIQKAFMPNPDEKT